MASKTGAVLLAAEAAYDEVMAEVARLRAMGVEAEVRPSAAAAQGARPRTGGGGDYPLPAGRWAWVTFRCGEDRGKQRAVWEAAERLRGSGILFDVSGSVLEPGVRDWALDWSFRVVAQPASGGAAREARHRADLVEGLLADAGEV